MTKLRWMLATAMLSLVACESSPPAQVDAVANEPTVGEPGSKPTAPGEYRVESGKREFAGVRVDALSPIEQAKDLRSGALQTTLWTHRDSQGRCFPALRYDSNADRDGGDVTNFLFEAKDLENWGWFETVGGLGETTVLLGPVCGRESNEIRIMQSYSGGLVWSHVNSLAKPDGPNSRYESMAIQGDIWRIRFAVDEPAATMLHVFRSEDAGKSWRFDEKRPMK